MNKDYQLGYLAGVAYEIQDIAFRIAATYESKTEHDFRDNTGSPFQEEIPKSFTLHAQSGISANTLLFGSAKWREWSKFKVQPDDFFSLVPGVGAVNTPIAKWAMVIVIVTPGRDQLSGVAQVGEQVLVEALVPEAAVEAFDKAVLHGLAWRDVVPLDLPVFLPFQNGIRRQFSPIARRED